VDFKDGEEDDSKDKNKGHKAPPTTKTSLKPSSKAKASPVTIKKTSSATPASLFPLLSKDKTTNNSNNNKLAFDDDYLDMIDTNF
jgi:hypothetical protein